MRQAARTLLLAGVLAVAGCGGGGSAAPRGAPPVIASFAVSPAWISAGQTATLSWSVTGASSLSIDPIGAVSGSSTQVAPLADATYVLTASNGYGSSQQQLTLAVFAAPDVWFAPIGATSAIPVQGAADYFDLFTPSAPWSDAAAHVTVFKLYSAMLNLDDTTLRNMFADLKRRHIALAIEWGPLDEPNRCGIGEGFDGTAALSYAQRIRDLGGSLQYIAFDEPYDGAALYQGPQACHWTPLQTAQNAAKNVAVIRSVFPDVVVGDIESLPNGAADAWLSGYEQWIDAWQAVTGKPLAFFHFDIDWSTEWQPGAAALTHAVRARHIPVGHIYNGNSGQSDAAWLALAEAHMEQFETHAGLIPDEAIFQSWEAYPKHLLPETDPTAFTYLIDRYFRARPALALTASSSTAQGTLTAAAAPLTAAPLTLTSMPLSGPGTPDTYLQSGSVPAGTQYVVFGARVAQENCSSLALPAEFYLSAFTLDAGSAGTLHADFSGGLSGWGIWGDAAVAQVEGTSLHVQLALGQTMGLNSDPLPFSAAGAPYTFTVNAMIPTSSRGEGCAIAVFLDTSQSEISRTVIQVVPQAVALGSLQTDTNGAFAFSLTPQPSPYVLWADYAGTDTLWPAAAAVGINAAAPLSVTTSALPDASVGAPYAQSLASNGGRSPYLWVAGPMPPGLVLGPAGSISGTPTRAGAYMLAVSVVDDSGPPQAADATLALVIH